MSGSPHRLVCPRCGESVAVELRPFIDEHGDARIELTCRLIVHDEPVRHVYDDPTFLRRSSSGGHGGLVGELDLYAKLEEIVKGLSGPSEHGVVEHLFAHAYPADYVTLWRLFGHVNTHGSKGYTVTVYLALRLGSLVREGAIAARATRATGCWSYNSAITAWSPVGSRDGDVLSWERFALTNGFDPNSWPATQLLPADELPDRPPQP